MRKFLIRVGLMILVFSFNLFSQWEQCSNGMSPGSVFSLAVFGSSLYAGTGSGIYTSSNYGSSWIQSSLNNKTVYSFAAKGNFLFASTMESGVYRSTDNGTSWSQTSLGSGSIHSLAVDGTDIYAANQENVFKSIDYGDSWEVVYTSQYLTISTLSENGNTVFLGGHGIFLTTNSGLNWLQTINTYPYIVNSLASRGGNVFAGAFGVFRSTNNGSTWIPVGLNNYYVRALYVNNTSTFAGTSDHGVYVSENNGESWLSKSEGFGSTPPIIRCFCVSGGYLFAGTWQQNLYRRFLNELTETRPMSSGIPFNYSLHQNYPNPFNPTTTIEFDIPSGAGAMDTRLVIYDISGKEVCTLLKETLIPGSYEMEWDASNYPSGVYYFKLISGDPFSSSGRGFTDTKKMILVK